VTRDGRTWAQRFDETVRPALAAHEALLAATPLVADPGTTDDVSLRDELADLADPTIWVGLGAHPGVAGQRLIFGRAVVGPEGSTAHRVFAAVDGASAPFLAVTDRRFLVVDRVTVPRNGAGRLARLLGGGETRLDARIELPRSAVVGAAPAPKGVVRRARLVVRFADESVCALNCSLPGVRDEVVASLRDGR
jgi:hypothetical protein